MSSFKAHEKPEPCQGGQSKGRGKKAQRVCVRLPHSLRDCCPLRYHRSSAHDAEPCSVGWAWRGFCHQLSVKYPAATGACVLRHVSKHLGRRGCVCAHGPAKTQNVTLTNVTFLSPLLLKVHVTKLSNLKTSVIDYNVRAEILSMGMGIDNSEHVEQLKKLHKEAKLPAFVDLPSQTS